MPLIAPPFDQPAPTLRAALDAVIVNAIVDDPRSQQTLLGPSEMGCPRCIARHFLGIEKLPHTTARTADAVPWLPWVGTALHSQLEGVFRAEDARLQQAGMPPRWLCETRVPVDLINGRYISGSMDLYDLWTATVIDWKLVGTTKMQKVRRHNHPGGIYQPQAHIYGRGMTLLGYEVRDVAVYFLPRNAISLSQGYFWTEPFDPRIAETAIENVKQIAGVAQSVRSLEYSTEREQAERELIARLAADPDCFSCSEYPPVGDENSDQDGRAVHADFDQPTSYSRRG